MEPRHGAALLLSLGLHGLLAALFLWLPKEARLDPIELRPTWFEIVEVPREREAQEPLPVPVPLPEDPTEEAPPPAALIRTPNRERPTTVALVEPSPPSGTEPGEGGGTATSAAPTTTASPTPGAATEPGPSSGPPVLTAEQRRLLAPGAVASAWYVPEGPGPSRRGPPASAALPGTERPTEAQIEAEHSGFLRARAMARSWVSRTRAEPRRQLDGTYVYEGHAFRAVIHRDGRVDFAQHSAVDLEREFDLSSGRFDLDALFQDVYRYERQRFLDDTEELRGRLEAEHRAQENADALRRLPGRLEILWTRGSRTPAARRHAIFELWDQAADDDIGRRARQIIERFVRERLPAGSDDAYDPAELRRLNADRESPTPFSPY
ncbi:MAG: hypothetical protein KC619_08565 [Myxococcales bacterium]|nr:hypothetical protein [Myxococcales bacterium]